MTELLQKAIERVQALPEDEQDRVARFMLDAAKAASEANGRGQEETQPIWEWMAEQAKNVPDEEWEKFPKDGAAEVDHYLYGTPKRNS